MISIEKYPSLKEGWHYTKENDFPLINEKYLPRVWVYFGDFQYSICEYILDDEYWEDCLEYDENERNFRYKKYEIIAWHILPTI